MNTRSSIRTLVIGTLLAASLNAQSGTTDIATAPLITDPTASVLPNVFLVLDDSLSMKYDFMPGEANDFNAGKYGIASNQCNGIYYDPTYRYTPPINSDGSSFANSTFTTAWIDGFNTGAGTVNLSTSFVDADSYYRSVDAAQPAFYYVYSGYQNTPIQQNYYNTNSVFYKECNSLVGSTTAVDGTHPVNTLFTKVVISAVTPTYTKGLARTDCASTSCTYAEESQNFANWYSYYRIRMLMMKTATGLAFKTIGNSFRMGYASANNNGSSDFLGLGQFDTTQKAAWYAKLYQAVPNNSSPLRIALANAGKMYANKLPTWNGSTVVDPIQYSCQQNFTILTSDGSWNGAAPTKLDGVAVGNQDGSVPRPQYDGTYQLSSTTQTTLTQTQQTQTLSQLQIWTQQNQSQTSNLQRKTGTLQWQTDQQYLDSTLQWQTNLQHTDAPLQWKTNLQSTTATLQWKTNLQHTDNTLQWQTNLQHTDNTLQWQTDLQATIQQQLWSTDQQITTAPLQWQTKQQITTANLQWATNLQTATAALQWQTNLQATTAALQWATNLKTATAALQWQTNLQATKGTLQKQTSQLQQQITQLQKQTSQLQSRTSTLQSSTMYLQTRTSLNSGGSWGAWSDVGSCTWAQQIDGFWRQCQYVTAVGGTTLWSSGAGTWSNAGSCITGFSTVTTAGTTWTGNGTSCRYYDPVGGVGGWSNWANSGSCNALAQSTGPAYTVGTATQCQYTSYTSWAGASSCSILNQSTAPNYTVGVATNCQSPVTTPYANAASCSANATPDASGFTTQCQYLAYTGWSTVISGSCSHIAQSSSPNYTVGVAMNCQLLSPATNYVATYPPTCAVTYNTGTTSGSSDASGNSISACSNTGVTYSTATNIGASGTCTPGAIATGTGGGSVQCVMASNTPAYVATYPPTCADTFNANSSASTANASGNVTDCTNTGATYSTPTVVATSGTCNGTLANVQCSIGSTSTAYVNVLPATCSTTWNGAAASSTATSGLTTVVTACTNTGATYSALANVGASKACATVSGTGPASSSTNCTISASPAYVSTYPPTCADTYSAGGTSTTNASGNVTDCTNTGATYSTPATVATGGTCNGTLANVQCSTSGGGTAYTTYAAPTCTTTYNGAAASSTATSGTTTVVTACPVSGSYSGTTTLTAGQACSGSATVQCPIGSTTTSYVTYNMALAASCSPNYGGLSGSSTAGSITTGSGTVTGVTTACPTSTFTTPAAIATCTPNAPHLVCSLGTGVTDYVGTYPPTCTTGNPGTGLVVTACGITGSGGAFGVTHTFGPLTNIGNGNTCTGGTRAALTPTWGNTVQCVATAGTATSYVATYPPTCSTNYNGLTGTSTANASGNVITACPNTGATYSGATTVAASGSCNGALANVKCIATAGTATNYVATYPPASNCTVNFNAAGLSTANASSKVTTACPVNGSYGSGTNVGASGTCNGTLANVQCDASTGVVGPAYIATYPPTCTTTYNGAAASSTANASGKVVTCSNTGVTYSSGTAVGASGTCNGAAANVQCATGTALSPAYVTTYPPTCTTNYAGAAASSTANASGNVITACPNTGATYDTAHNSGANATCNGALTNVRCAISGGTATLFTTYPPTCTLTYNGAAASSTANASGIVRSCPTTSFGSWTNAAATCTTSSTVNCQYNWGSYSNVTSGTCTDNYSSSSPYSILSSTMCRYSALTTDADPGGLYTAWADYAGATCPAVAQPAASGSSTYVVRNCRVVNANTSPANTPAWPTQAWLATGSCSATVPAGSFDATGKNVQCQTYAPASTIVDTCTPSGPNAGNNYFDTSCATNYVLNAGVPVHNIGVASCTNIPASASTSPPHATTTCNTTTTAGVHTVNCVDTVADSSNNWTATTCSGPMGGSSDTLSDVAQYYYMTDLRTTALGNDVSGASGLVNGTDVSANNVFTSDADSATYQHMTTFTVGLGTRGRMVFDPNYQTATSGDYYSVAHGVTADGASVCSWELANAECDWPVPAYDTPEDIDDLWHAAVDGRGTYFSAKNPSDLSIGLTGALANIETRLGSASAATTSTAFVTQGDNFLFRSSYVSVNWTGELTRQQIDINTGSILSTIDWSAQSQLDTNASRVIYTYDPTNAHNGGGSNKLKLFSYTNLTTTEQTYFDLATLHASGHRLSQFAYISESCSTDLVCLSQTDESNATGANLVNYLKGTRTNEGGKGDNTKYYRQRLHLLGDIVDSETVYVKAPSANFSDAGYGTFKQNNLNRRAMVYVGANDGMLHAFRASDDAATTTINEGGQEDWAYIPTFVMPNLYLLADKSYGQNHQFFVDGTPVPADICVSNCTTEALASWKTIVIGGLNRGGTGYYALDVTDPANPKALWEFTDANMGYTFGNPKVVKLQTGQWVVLVTSGYNNTTGDGQGHLYVLNAATGVLIRDITTGVGSSASPSGLARIDAPVTTPGVDATVMAVYGGDVFGNLWRFDVNGDLGAAGYDAQLIATLKDSSGNVQPITAKPLVSLVDTNLIVFIGTGRFLGTSDELDTHTQSFYGIKDGFPANTTPSTPIYADSDFRGASPTFVQQVHSEVTCPSGTSASICVSGQTVTVTTSNPVNFATQNGWFVDFLRGGERDNTDPAIVKSTLVVVTNLPSSSSCAIGGDSYLYQLDYRSGGAVSSSPTGVIGGFQAHELSSRPVIFCLQDGTCDIVTQLAGGTLDSHEALKNQFSDGVARRVSWRELLVQ